mmetsp:Transcript_2369/g.2859  ORF Transcript_2369/g.2859 Transcript_2369/m.2859 type:complete len:108 (+) Transcript_2369:45-368(+)
MFGIHLWKQNSSLILRSTRNFLQPFAAGNNSILDSFGGITTWRSKMKSNRSAAKRFRIRGNGKLVRNQQGAQHNTGYRSRNRNNRVRQSTGIKNKKLERKMKRLILG